MRREYLVLGGIAIVLTAALVPLLGMSADSTDVPFELARAVLTLLTAVLITGGLSFWLNQRSSERTRMDDRERVLTAALQELKAGYERVQVARFFLMTSATATTFREQVPFVAEARSRLHRVQRERFITKEIDHEIQQMLNYLSAPGGLLQEYRANHVELEGLALAQERQRGDFLDGKLDEPPVEAPLPHDRFPLLAAFIAQDRWEIGAFHTSYRKARDRIQFLLGARTEGVASESPSSPAANSWPPPEEPPPTNIKRDPP